MSKTIEQNATNLASLATVETGYIEPTYPSISRLRMWHLSAIQALRDAQPTSIFASIEEITRTQAFAGLIQIVQNIEYHQNVIRSRLSDEIIIEQIKPLLECFLDDSIDPTQAVSINHRLPVLTLSEYNFLDFTYRKQGNLDVYTFELVHRTSQDGSSNITFTITIDVFEKIIVQLQHADTLSASELHEILEAVNLVTLEKIFSKENKNTSPSETIAYRRKTQVLDFAKYDIRVAEVLRMLDTYIERIVGEIAPQPTTQKIVINRLQVQSKLTTLEELTSHILRNCSKEISDSVKTQIKILIATIAQEYQTEEKSYSGHSMQSEIDTKGYSKVIERLLFASAYLVAAGIPVHNFIEAYQKEQLETLDWLSLAYLLVVLGFSYGVIIKTTTANTVE